jgi:catechol 2,3-dioxygenase-like lactoylglutathione lyase family enzyme
MEELTGALSSGHRKIRESPTESDGGVKRSRGGDDVRGLAGVIPEPDSCSRGRTPEVTMSSTQARSEPATRKPNGGMVETKLEVVVVPVSDVDRAKRFYGNMGWRLDADFVNGSDWRAVQMTPPGSPTSVIFGKGITTAAPGSVQGLLLAVDDIGAARAEMVGHGVDVSEVFHFEGNFQFTGTQGRAPGPDAQGRSYSSWASFSDPDGNGWLLQEIKSRLPGRGLSLDVPTLTELLRETEQRHGAYEATAPKHHWSGWYAAYIVARERGRSAEDAAKDAALHMERTRQ